MHALFLKCQVGPYVLVESPHLPVCNTLSTHVWIMHLALRDIKYTPHSPYYTFITDNILPQRRMNFYWYPPPLKTSLHGADCTQAHRYNFAQGVVSSKAGPSWWRNAKQASPLSCVHIMIHACQSGDLIISIPHLHLHLLYGCGREFRPFTCFKNSWIQTHLH